MSVLNTNSLVVNNTDVKEQTPEWTYRIVSQTNSNDTRDVYCYFPSKLKFREGYLNTHYEAYLYYGTPPDAFSESFDGEKIIRIQEDDWNNLIKNNIVVPFPISRVIFANKWRHSGTQTVANEEGFDKNNYIIISKPSSVWYMTKSKNDQIEYNYTKNAIEDMGSLVLFSLDFSPIRYILHPDYTVWGTSNKDYSIYAALWDNSINFEKTSIIYNKKGGIWTGNYPIMHRLELRNNNKYEDFIADDMSLQETVNSLNHPTTIYHISTTQDKIKDMSEIWNNIYVNLF